MRSATALSPAIEGTLQGLYDTSPSFPLASSSRLLVLSDLHLGDGSSRDDFLPNGVLLREILGSYYLPRGSGLVLNGDVEELQRFSLARIRSQWGSLYEQFEGFSTGAGLHRIVGNHDEALWRHTAGPDGAVLRAGIRLSFGAETLFVFHGHQATIFFERFNELSGFFLRHFANRLHIRNAPAHYESTRRYRTEHRVYAFSSSRRIVSVIGHTHRPLFESLSRADSLRSRIEQLCREYPAVPARVRREIEEMVEGYKKELELVSEREGQDGGSLYGDALPIPCLFNSGCAVGNRGLTAIEIEDGHIALVHWFDSRLGDRRRPADVRRDGARRPGRDPLVLPGELDRRRDARRERSRNPPRAESTHRFGDTPFYRSVLKRDRLDYVFSRIRLLA